MFFNFFIIFGRLYLFLFKKKKAVISLTAVIVVSNLVINNFNDFRYQTKYDSKGNRYTHDLITGKKYKMLNNI